MLILQIKRLVSFQSQPLPNNAQSWTAGANQASMFAGEHPSNPQTGTVTIDVRLIEGSFDHIRELRFITDNSPIAKLISSKKQWLGGYRIVVDFETTFLQGLQYMISLTIPVGGGVIGMTEEEINSMNTYDVQGKMLAMLTHMIMPKHNNTILKLARPAIYFIHVATKTPHHTHLTGKEELPIGGSVPQDNTGKPLFHLGTLKTSELPPELNLHHLKAFISFYLRTHNDGPWPYRQGDYAVLTYENMSTTPPSDTSFDASVYVDMKSVLEIPHYAHSSILQLKFNAEDAAAYEALESTYKSILDPLYDFHAYSKVGGYPDNVQGCVAYEAELIHHHRQHGEETERDAINWHLLFQLIPDNESFTFTKTFGDGSIFFMIKADKLQQGDLSEVQVVIQNT